MDPVTLGLAGAAMGAASAAPEVAAAVGGTAAATGASAALPVLASDIVAPTLAEAGGTALMNASLGGSLGQTLGGVLSQKPKPAPAPARPTSSMPTYQPTANQFRQPPGSPMRISELLKLMQGR